MPQAYQDTFLVSDATFPSEHLYTSLHLIYLLPPNRSALALTLALLMETATVTVLKVH